MKILSWNIERPKIDDNRKIEIIELINSFDADLIFLTETNSDINFSNYFSLKTNELPPNYKGVKFHKGENRATIYSKYPIVEEIETYDSFSSICCKIETEFGALILYSSIIGFLGGRDDFFKKDLKNQKEDLTKICIDNNNVCFSGDLNISFSGYSYPSKRVVKEMDEFFDKNDLVITTRQHKDSAIHILLSKLFIDEKNISTNMIGVRTGLSDHNIVITEIK